MAKVMLILVAVAVCSVAGLAQMYAHIGQVSDSARMHTESATNSAMLMSPKHEHIHHSMHSMTAITSLSLPMTRNGSGTGWQPDASPMYAYMNHNIGNGWQMMAHGSLFLRQGWVNINNSSKRNATDFDAPNFIMVMLQKHVGTNGLLGFEAMLSADALTIGGPGYPLLLQTGETWNNKPLIDRQHPHDVFAALAILYTQRMNSDVDVSAYVGYPGEPALGPTAFMHRASSIANPDAPLGHHWLDATHIVFGVSTLGLRVGTVKAEGSIFTGKEPNEDRYDFDRPLFDSYSWRVSWAPSSKIVAQLSQGYLHEPEAFSSANITRTTASIQFASGDRSAWWTGIIAVGQNDAGHDHKEWAVLAEASVDLEGTIPFVRAEWVQKTEDELQLISPTSHGSIENIGALSAGIAQRLTSIYNTDVSVGTKATVNMISSELELVYGTTPLSVQVFLRLTPKLL